MRLALTIVILFGAAETAQAAKPAIGVEWEIDGGIAVTALRGTTPSKILRLNPVSYPPQLLCLAKKTSAPAKVPVEIPLVTITYDMGETDRTLEIVTGPIGSDFKGADQASWQTAFHFVEAFFDAVKGSCTVTKSTFTTKVPNAPDLVEERKLCFASIKDIAAKMGETMKTRGLDASVDSTLTVKTGVECGARQSFDTKTIGVWLSIDSTGAQAIDPFTLPFDGTNTQVNIATPLALWGGPNLVPALAELDPWNEANTGAVGSGSAPARLAAEQAAKLLGGVKDPAVRGFFILYALALNAETLAIDNKWEGVDQKNSFVVYLKSSLGLLHDLLAQQGRTPTVDSLGLKIDVDPVAVDAIKKQLCFLTIPCAVATWNKQILGKEDPIRPFARKPIKPYLDDTNEPTVVVETRWGKSALGLAATIAVDSTGALGFADVDTLDDKLRAFR